MTDSLKSSVRDAAWQLRDRIEKLADCLEPLPTSPDEIRAADEILAAAMDHCLLELAATRVWGRDNQFPSGVLWEIVGELLSLGDLQRNARTKPRGYAGDFQMLFDLCTYRIGDHPLGQSFDRYFQRQAAPQAVRNRTQIMAQAIVKKLADRDRPLRIASIGSGPAFEIETVLRRVDDQQRRHLQVQLWDIDPHALEFAASRLSERLPPDQLQSERVNLFRMARQPAVRQRLAENDLVYCTGLFDYFDDDDAVAMLRMMWEGLVDGGEMYVFNFSQFNPSRAYMEWMGNWYLIHRTTDQLWDLADRADVPVTQMDAEPEGVNLYVRAVK